MRCVLLEKYNTNECVHSNSNVLDCTENVSQYKKRACKKENQHKIPLNNNSAFHRIHPYVREFNSVGIEAHVGICAITISGTILGSSYEKSYYCMFPKF